MWRRPRAWVGEVALNRPVTPTLPPQAICMFVGEALCYIAFRIQAYRTKGTKVEERTVPGAPPPALARG